MRVVLDTNVFISGLFFKDVPGKILNAWTEGIIEIVLSPDIYDEYINVIQELREKYTTNDLDIHLDRILTHAQFVDVPEFPERISKDPDDDKFLACPVYAKVSFIVSGDSDLLEVLEFQGVSVLTPRDFIDKYLNVNE